MHRNLLLVVLGFYCYEETTNKEKHVIMVTRSQFIDWTHHYHDGKQGSVQADMVLELGVFTS